MSKIAEMTPNPKQPGGFAFNEGESAGSVGGGTGAV